MLIKGKHNASGLAVRDLPTTAPPGRAPAEAAADAPSAEPVTAPEVVALEAEIKRLRSESQHLIESAKAAEAQAFEKGKEAGLAEHHRNEADLAARIETAAEGARVRLDAQIVQIENLALAVASTAMDNVLGCADTMAAQVVRAVQVQLDGVRAESVIRVRVSGADFTDDAALFDHAGTVANAGLDWVRDDTLRSGQVRMDLRLGDFGLDLVEHWESVTARLSTLVQTSDGERP